MGDQQHGLRRGGQQLLQPALGGHVEVVVGLVEQQHLLRPAEQRLEHEALLLAAGQRPHATPAGTLERDAQGRRGAHVPQRLGLVSAGVGPVRQGLRVAQLRRLVVGVHHRQLRGVQLGGRGRHPRRGYRDEQVAHGAGVAERPDELAHHPEPPAAGHRAPAGVEVAGDDPQHRGLAGAVRAYQGRRRPLADAEGHLGQQRSPVRQPERDLIDIDVAHAARVCPVVAAASAPFPPPGRATGTRHRAAPPRGRAERGQSGASSCPPGGWTGPPSSPARCCEPGTARNARACRARAASPSSGG